MDAWTYGCTDARTHGRMDIRVQVYMETWMHGHRCRDRQMHGRTDARTHRRTGTWMYGCTSIWVHRPMGAQTQGRTDTWTRRAAADTRLQQAMQLRAHGRMPKATRGPAQWQKQSPPSMAQGQLLPCPLRPRRIGPGRPGRRTLTFLGTRSSCPCLTGCSAPSCCGVSGAPSRQRCGQHCCMGKLRQGIK